MNPLLRFFASPKTALFNKVAAGGVVSLLWGLRMPGGDVPFFLIGVLLILVTLLFAILQLLVLFVFRAQGHSKSTKILSGCHAWAWGLFLALGVIFALPFKLAFFVSHPSLHRVCETALHGTLPAKVGWVGLFPISSVTPIEGGIEFTFNKKEIPWGSRGLYFSVNGQPINLTRYYSQSNLGGGWYSWHYGGW